MSSKGQASNLVSQRYANALLDLAQDLKSVEKVEKDLLDLETMIISSPDFRNALTSPLFDKKSLAAAVTAIADKAKLQGVTKNFLNVLVQNSRLAALPFIIQAFTKELSVKRGNVTVDVTVAQDLSAKQKQDLETALAKGLGKNVAVRLEVEPSILGGMIVTVGSKMIDDSVARKLERLRISLGVQANENTNNNSNLSEVV